MSKRQYSDKEKGAALAYLDFIGGNTRAAAKTLGIPHTTLQDWVKERGVNEACTEIRTEKKEELSDLIETALREMLGASKDKIEEANFQQLWTGIGIGVDKRQLLTGKPTTISETLSDEERAKRTAEILERGKLRLVKNERAA